MAEEDIISSLPDCLLLEIISRLPTTKHAIKKTSTLSKRWQHLWTLLPNLIFIASEDVLKRGYYYPSYCYFLFINKTLTQSHVNLNKFKLCIGSTYDHTDFHTWDKSQINSCIRYAITRNVQEVDIELWVRGELGGFRLDDFFFKNLCATQMKLTGFVFINPIGAISWKKLKCLCISAGKLDEEVIADILSGSPCLETLKLDDCYGFKSINVTSKSVKNLVFSNYDCTKSGKDYYKDSIKINAPYIFSLTISYLMELQELLLLNVSSLDKADLDYWSVFSLFGLDDEEEEELLKGLLRSLSHVKNITLGDSALKVLSRLEAKGFKFFEGADNSD